MSNVIDMYEWHRAKLKLAAKPKRRASQPKTMVGVEARAKGGVVAIVFTGNDDEVQLALSPVQAYSLGTDMLLCAKQALGMP